MAIQGYWRLNGNSNDASGNGNNGTDTVITYSQANGRLNQGAGFNGSSSGISIVDNSALTPTSSGTIIVFVKPTVLPASGNIMGIIDKRDNANGTNGWLIQLYNNAGTQEIRFQTKNVTGILAIAQYALSTSEWSMIAVTYTSGIVPSLYVNAKKLTLSQSYAGTIQNYATPLRFGRRSDGYYYNGSIDEIIIDNTEYSPAKLKNRLMAIKGFF